MKKKNRMLSFWEKDWVRMAEYAKELGYGNGNMRKPGISRMLTYMFRDQITQTRTFSHETRVLLMKGSAICCKGNVDEFVKKASEEWINSNS